MSKLKLSQTIGARFTRFQTAMRSLAGFRSCDCELVGLERGMELATHAIHIALPVMSALELGVGPVGALDLLSRHQIALAYYPVVMVGMILTKEIGMELECPDKLRTGRLAAVGMLEALVPYIGETERAWHDEILLGPSEAHGYPEVHSN